MCGGVGAGAKAGVGVVERGGGDAAGRLVALCGDGGGGVGGAGGMRAKL